MLVCHRRQRLGKTLLVDARENKEQLPEAEGNSEVLRIHKVDNIGTLADDNGPRLSESVALRTLPSMLMQGQGAIYLLSGIFKDYQLTLNFTSLREP